MTTRNTIIIFAFAAILIGMPLATVDAMKIRCAENTDLDEFPICRYVTEWNESEEFDRKVLAELSLKVNEINEDPESYPQIYQETIKKVNQENPGLQEKCEKLRAWISEQIRAN